MSGITSVIGRASSLQAPLLCHICPPPQQLAARSSHRWGWHSCRSYRSSRWTANSRHEERPVARVVLTTLAPMSQVMNLVYVHLFTRDDSLRQDAFSGCEMHLQKCCSAQHPLFHSGTWLGRVIADFSGLCMPGCGKQQFHRVTRKCSVLCRRVVPGRFLSACECLPHLHLDRSS